MSSQGELTTTVLPALASITDTPCLFKVSFRFPTECLPANTRLEEKIHLLLWCSANAKLENPMA